MTVVLLIGALGLSIIAAVVALMWADHRSHHHR